MTPVLIPLQAEVLVVTVTTTVLVAEPAVFVAVNV